MRCLFILLIAFYGLHAHGQPKDKMSQIKSAVVQVRNSTPPYSESDYVKLIEIRKELEEFANDSAASREIRVAYYSFLTENFILKHQLSIGIAHHNLNLNNFYAKFRNFFLFKTNEASWKRKQQEYLRDIHLFISFHFGLIRDKEGLTQFLECSEHELWYQAFQGDRLLDSINLLLDAEQGLDQQLGMLKSAAVRIDSSCHSIHSRYYPDGNCVHQRMKGLEVQIAENRTEQKRKAEWKRQRQHEVEAINRQMERADSLFHQGKLIEALNIYEITKKTWFDGNSSLERIREIKLLQQKQLIYDRFLYDTLGRLRVDSTKSISELELKQIKDNRALISAQIVRELYAYESDLYKSECRKPGFELTSLLPYQILDTTKHLYQIRCDSSGIEIIEHTLLSENKKYGAMTDSLIRIALPSIDQYLRISDDLVHEYFIPVIYIPTRYRYGLSYYCNCHFLESPVYSMKVKCSNDSAMGVMFNNNSVYDEYYFVITDGQPASY